MASFLRGTGISMLRTARPSLPIRPVLAPVSVPVLRRGALQVVAAEPDKKVQKKRTDPAVKRDMLGKERRMYNKARKSACATRIKKVITLAESLVSDTSKAEAEVPSLERLISEAYCEIDKAVTKGVLHKNNAARKKARCARYKRKVLILSGLWTPPADHSDFKLVAKAKKATTA